VHTTILPFRVVVAFGWWLIVFFGGGGGGFPAADFLFDFLCVLL